MPDFEFNPLIKDGFCLTNSTRVTALENVYVRSQWYKEIGAGTSGTLVATTEVGTSAEFVADQWPAGVDMLVSVVTTGEKPDREPPRDASGNPITATFNTGTGAWSLSGTPTTYPIALIYCYRQKFVNFSDAKALVDWAYELPTSTGLVVRDVGSSNTEQHVNTIIFPNTSVTPGNDGSVTISIPDTALDETYFLLAGRSGGQIGYGGTGTGEDLELHSNTSKDADIKLGDNSYFDESNDNLRIAGQGLFGGVTETIDDFLIGHWKLNDNAADTDVIDSSNLSFDGTLRGGNFTEDLSVAGKINTALDLDGSHDYIDLVDSTTVPTEYKNLSYTESFSIVCWIKTTDGAPAGSYWFGDATIVELRNEGGEYFMHVPFSFGIESNVLTLGRSSNHTSEMEREVGTTQVNDGEWHMVAAVMDVSTETVYFYVDNALDVSRTFTTAVGDCSVGTAPSNFQIGVRSRDNGGKNDSYFDGIIDNVQIYSDTISLTDIQTLYNSGSGTETAASPGTISFSAVAITSSYDSGHHFDTLNDLSVEGNFGVKEKSYFDDSAYFDGTVDFDNTVNFDSNINISIPTATNTVKVTSTDGDATNPLISFYDGAILGSRISNTGIYQVFDPDLQDGYAEFYIDHHSNNPTVPRAFFYVYGDSYPLSAGLYTAPGQADGAAYIPSFIAVMDNREFTQSGNSQLILLIRGSHGSIGTMTEGDLSSQPARDLYLGGGYSSTYKAQAHIVLTDDETIGVPGSTVPGGRFHLIPNDASTVGVILQGFASQLSDILQIKDSSGNIHHSFSLPGATDPNIYINKQVGDSDFIVAGDTEANLLRVDAGTDTVRLGDWDTNYAQFAVDGELTLTGTARVIQEVNISASSVAPGASGVTETTLGTYVGYAFGIGDDMHATFEIPPSWDSSTDLDVRVYWCIDEAYATNNGEIQWNIDWAATPSDASEAVDAPTHTGTIDYGDENIPATAKYLTKSTGGTISAASLSAGDTLGLNISRVAIDDGSNPTAEPVLLRLEVEFTANKLGEPT